MVDILIEVYGGKLLSNLKSIKADLERLVNEAGCNELFKYVLSCY